MYKTGVLEDLFPLNHNGGYKGLGRPHTSLCNHV